MPRVTCALTVGWLAGLLIAGCGSAVDGTPAAAPSARPSVSPPTAKPPQPTTPASPSAPAGAIPLPPDQDGYVFIETKSGQTRC
ncbi:MAG: hypothetical protein ACRDTV_26080, partial [Mycobacterium sp.]